MKAPFQRRNSKNKTDYNLNTDILYIIARLKAIEPNLIINLASRGFGPAAEKREQLEITVFLALPAKPTEGF